MFWSVLRKLSTGHGPGRVHLDAPFEARAAGAAVAQAAVRAALAPLAGRARLGVLVVAQDGVARALVLVALVPT